MERSSTITFAELFASLPGFSTKYIGDRIETIFQNGLPVDDIETGIDGPAPVIAISGAMPGLAGAIFRKNSFHAALRTSDSNALPDKLERSEGVLIRLKFFNVIASEKGGTILNSGCFMKSDSVLKFINYRPRLFSEVLSLHCNDESLGLDDMKTILHKSETVYLRIQEDNVAL